MLLGGVSLIGGCSSGAGEEESGAISQDLSCNLGLSTALSSACTKAGSEASITASPLASVNPAQVIADNSA